MFLCHLPVFLNTHEVDKGRAAGDGEDVDEGREPVLVPVNQDQEGAESLQDPVEHVELHCHQVSVLSLHSYGITYTTHIFVLLLAESILI